MCAGVCVEDVRSRGEQLGRGERGNGQRGDQSERRLTFIRDKASVGDGSSGGRTGLPELPPLLDLDGGRGVGVDLCVAVEEDVLLERGVFVHAVEFSHGDDGLLALSARAGPRALNIVVGRHVGVELGIGCCSYVLLYPVTLGTEKAFRAT